MRLSALIIAEARASYRRRFDGRFYVLLWPRWYRGDQEDRKAFRAILKEQSLEVLEPEPLPGGLPDRIHPRDPHPSPEEYDHVAAFLATQVGSLEETR